LLVELINMIPMRMDGEEIGLIRSDLFPADPFGMELSSNFAAAIVGRFEDLGANPGGCQVYCWDGD